jgi:putative acetyltransferase
MKIAARLDEMHQFDGLEIRQDDPSVADVSPLFEQLDSYLSALYPPESNHGVSAEWLRLSGAVFITARLHGQPVGCGSIVNCAGEYAEIKRVFVLPQFRGLQIGRRIMEELERQAQTWGLRLIRLETGIHQPEALLLFERTGYQRRGPFGDYQLDPLSVFMEKSLR